MRIVDSLPFPVREIEHVWIPLDDGARLGARVWLPEGAGPVPAVVEYIPYRKRDDTRWRDEPMHGYFAGHGYASVRVDVRGAGTSDGVIEDEYSDAEWSDGLQMLAWVAAQPWCDGGVALLGKSWGGINALQIAALQPPELRCVVSVCSSDDRWTTDAHWMGGCLLNENLIWGAVLQTLAMRPQDPELVGDGWRDTWLTRLAESPVYAAKWLAHDTRDAYWRRGSVAEAYERIRVPVLAVSGWADAYADTVPRLLAGLGPPSRGVVGPWAHVYPHNGVPGPPAGFLQMALGWFERWMKEGASPDHPESAYRVWMTEGGGRPWAEEFARGRWIAEDGWPSSRVEVETRPLAADEDAEPVALPWTGAGALAAGGWCPFGMTDLAREQSVDDEASARFDMPELAERLELLGAPEVELTLTSDRPETMVAVRLCDVAPDGSSVRVSYGLLDLAFRDGYEARRPISAGEPVTVRVPLRHLAHAFPAGHRIRIAVSSSYWPIAWPPGAPVGLVVLPAGSRIHLPVRAPRPEDAGLTPLPPPEVGPSPAFAVEDPPPTVRRLHVDEATGTVTMEARQGFGPDGEPAATPVEPIGLWSGWGIEERFTLRPDDPGATRMEVRQVVTSARRGWSTRLEVAMRQTRTDGGFLITGEVVAHENGAEIYRRTIDERV